MSGLAVAYWQKLYDNALPKIEEILHKKFDQLDKFQAISMENLSDWQHKQMKDLADETQEMVAFLEIIKAIQKSYIKESADVADCLKQQWVENQQLIAENIQLRQENGQLRAENQLKEAMNSNILEKYHLTIKDLCQ